jgi:TonB family protein
MHREDVERRRMAVACALSIGAHGSVVLVAVLLIFVPVLFERSEHPALARTTPRPELVDIELPGMLEGTIASDKTVSPPKGTPLPRGGGETDPRPDTGRAGRGGTDLAEQQAINLADRDDATLLEDEVRSRIDRNQIQRVESARDRASGEDWRASREPMELSFLAVGKGTRPERLKPAPVDPSVGAPSSAAPSRLGSNAGAEELAMGVGLPRRDPGTAEAGGATSSPGLGLRDGRPGDDHHASANVAEGRPMVNQGTPSVPSNEQGKPRDTADSEQEVAAAMQSIVHASSAGGKRGNGPGGQAGEGPTGAGGVNGGGSQAKALGSGTGTGVDNDLRDARRMTYLRQVMAKIHPLWANAFPRSAALEGLQGTAIITFVIGQDGNVTSAVVSRPSGIPEFDENCRMAVLRGSPFGPLPPELGASFRWAMPFEARNPAVRPKPVEPIGVR